MVSNNKERIKVVDQLANLLKESHIPFQRFLQISFRNVHGPEGYMVRNQLMFDDSYNGSKKYFSAICHIGSYGFTEGLLEVAFRSGEPSGYLTVDEAYKLIYEYWDCNGGFAHGIQD